MLTKVMATNVSSYNLFSIHLLHKINFITGPTAYCAKCNAFECFLQFEHFPDCSNREYQSTLDEYSEKFTYYASIILWPVTHGQNVMTFTA